MKVTIAEDVVSNPDYWRFLDRIINKIADEWHVWQIDDTEVIEASGWLERTGCEWLQELFNKAAMAADLNAHADFPKQKIIVSTKPLTDALPPRQAADYVSTPLVILMENRFTDGLFINSVLDFLAPEAINEQRQNAPGFIYYDSSGGIGELPKLITDYVQQRKSKGIPFRGVVFTDSDAKIPGEIHKNARLVQETCETEDVPCLILSKCTIENYIPDEVLEAWIPSTPHYEKRCILEAVKRLKPAQRDHYPMKKGLNLSGASASVHKLYENISEADRIELAKGFGKEVIEKLNNFNNVITAKALRQRDGQGELDYLVELILSEL
ncbi:hypothetical protein QUF61_07050 [Candidatus Venteria ishoeyi]|uniref:hypothetical protein n=1 Tax=Candidatus Venteria ishoeyi TaxID=1899563 RepID=UPI0025A61A13|nr:hypothetical protein [Candidatus Venteria ishoeyi]MDM8546236.1 hypothetical protein [Candidatus Venteria ishoeyi]